MPFVENSGGAAGGGSGTVTQVSSANAGITVANGTTAAVLTKHDPAVTTVAASGASQTATLPANIDAAFDITLTANCTLTLTGGTAGELGTLTLVLRQDGTGGRTVTWPGSVTWLSGVTPSLHQGASAVDTIVLSTVDGGTSWLGVQAGGPAAIGADGWITDSSETWTFASATTFTVAGVDVTAKYSPGTRLKLTQTTVKYFVVASSVFGTDTTVTVTGGSDFSLANAAISSNFHSYVDNPQGFPGWFNFAAATTGVTSDTTVSRFSVVGRICTIMYLGQGTSSATTKTFTLPVAVAQSINGRFAAGGFGRDNGSTTATVPRFALPTSAGQTTVTVTAAPVGTAWTGSGSWAAMCTFAYEI